MYLFNKKSSHQKGFTLLEILLVVGIIAILAGIVIIAINPARQLAQARNTERRSSISEINKALTQYYIDHRTYPDNANLDSTLTDICDTGNEGTGHDIDCDDMLDLSALVPTYLTAIPADPKATTTGSTGYQLARLSTGRIVVEAPIAELSQDITIGTTTGGLLSTYTVTFNANGGTGSMSAQTIARDASVNLTSNSFTRTSYTFTGWATTTTGAVAYANGASYTMGSANVTLYAKWTANPTYTVTFDANGGTGSMSAQTIEGGASANLTANSFTRTSYTFAGWATSAGGSVAYADQASYTMGSANVTLYAKWNSAVSASGGTITTSGSYRIHTFTSSGSFVVSGGSLAVDILVVAGGGAGGGNVGGGGGGGGVIATTTTVSAGTISVTVGAGGASGSSDPWTPSSGGNSSFAGFTAIGGGKGAYAAGSAANGGSGGGGAVASWGLTNGQGTAGQGYAGGTSSASAEQWGAGGGGGAGGAGSNNSSNSLGGNGGPGVASNISGSTVYYGGGGGGWPGGSGGTGGGGNASQTAEVAASPGTANTGGGGGGERRSAGGHGGSGIVIVRYLQ